VYYLILQLRQYADRWQDISLSDLSGRGTDSGSPADPELYSRFYTQLAQGGNVTERWVKDKATLGSSIASEVFQSWARCYGRRPRVLALAVGRGVAEGVWLEQGYDVTLHECQQTSMRQLCERFPHAPTLIADMRGIVIPWKFDIVVMLASEYVLTRDELISLLQTIEKALDQNGWMVLQSVSVLSIVRLGKEIVKRLRGGYPSPEHVFWGWWRTPAELAACAADAGLLVTTAYRAVQAPGGGTVLQRRARGLRFTPTWSDTSLVMLLEHA
jgi:hypothetical protein